MIHGLWSALWYANQPIIVKLQTLRKFASSSSNNNDALMHANDTNNDPGSHDRHLRRDPAAAGDLLHARLAHLAGLRGRGARHPRHLHHHRLQVTHHKGEILKFL